VTDPGCFDEPVSHPEAFRTTRWTQVLQARGDSAQAKAALSDLCAAYYAPVFGFIRRNTPDEEADKDLTQEFFKRLLARHGIEGVEPSRGCFRSFLLGAVKHFQADIRKNDRRQKRGGGQALQPLEPGTDTSPGLQLPDPAAPNPEREFDRKWALTMLERALGVLAREQQLAGKTAQFEALKPWLNGEIQHISQAETARQLGLNEGALKVAIHRLRRRFREVLKTEIGQTLSDRAQVDEELRYLLEALL
jgi:RNA polymerase sigma-70 factor (ECF subfamily)